MAKKRNQQEIDELVAEAREIWGDKAAYELRRKLEAE